MSSPTPDGLKAELDESKLKIGNIVLASTGSPTTASQNLYVDANKKLAQGALPFILPISQTTSTEGLFDLSGSSTADVMTTTIVADGSGGATTFTKKGYIRIKVTDTGDNITDGYYYIQVGTLT